MVAFGGRLIRFGAHIYVNIRTKGWLFKCLHTLYIFVVFCLTRLLFTLYFVL